MSPDYVETRAQIKHFIVGEEDKVYSEAI